MTTAYAVFLCVRLIRPDPATGITEYPCTITNLPRRFETIEACNAYIRRVGTYTRHDDQGRFFLPDSGDNAVSWNECRLTDRAPPPPSIERGNGAAAAEETHRDLTSLFKSWQAQMISSIQRAWIRPPGQPGIECVLNITQLPGGEVTKVSIGQCNGDQTFRQSIEAAVFRASPLPPPPDPRLFDPRLTITFKGD